MDNLEKQNDPTPPALERYAASRTLVKFAAEQPHGIYLRRGAFENSGAVILVCAGEPVDVDAVIEFGEQLKWGSGRPASASTDTQIIQQPEEQKTEMKITKIGYGISMADPYSGAREEVYMEAELEKHDREFINIAVEKLKSDTRKHLGSNSSAKVLAANVIALEQRVTFHQDQLKKLRAQLDKLNGIWSAIESLLGKYIGGDRPKEAGIYKAETQEQQQH